MVQTQRFAKFQMDIMKMCAEFHCPQRLNSMALTKSSLLLFLTEITQQQLDWFAMKFGTHLHTPCNMRCSNVFLFFFILKMQ